MAVNPETGLPFVAMTTINKKSTLRENNCTDWVATEKVHGASFQFFTNDGKIVHLASRRNVLNLKGSFQRCNLREFHDRHYEYVRRIYSMIENDERWLSYRTWEENSEQYSDDEEEEELEEGEGDRGDENSNHDNANSDAESNEESTQSDSIAVKTTELRIYGELYGGGGVELSPKSAVQKEILYSDEFRFYVFGITVNRKWMTVSEMNDLCLQAGFPYYATPVCEPKKTLTELTEWLDSSGFMQSKSRLTDRADNHKTKIEGVVMTPLTRRGYRLHPIKLLSDAFNDVRAGGKGANQKPNYCTKARYHSVLSKLDIPEREDARMVSDMFIADILKESGETIVSNKERKNWSRFVTTWLREDGYIKNEDNQHRKATAPAKGHDATSEDDTAARAEGLAENDGSQDDLSEDIMTDIDGLFS